MPGRKIAIVLGTGLALFAVCEAVAGIFLCEVTLHPYSKPPLAGQASDHARNLSPSTLPIA